MDKEVLDILSKSFLFNNIKRKDIELIHSKINGKKIRLSPKEVLIKEGDIVGNIGVVLSGEIKIAKYDIDGKENLLGRIKKFQTIGANIAYTPTKISPFYLFSRGVSFVYLFNHEEIKQLDKNYSINIYNNIIKYLSNDNIKKEYKIDVISKNKIKDRILTYLEIQSNKKKSNEFEIPFNREEMANYLCVNRSALSHELSILKKDGIIDFKKNWFKIYNNSK